MQRRDFIKAGAVAVAAAPSITRAVGRDKIRMGFIGIGQKREIELAGTGGCRQ